MNNSPNNFSKLRFDRIRLPNKSFAVLGAGAIFVALWRLTNPNTFFWVSLVLFVLLAWVATYGWRQALFNIIHFLQRLERI